MVPTLHQTFRNGVATAFSGGVSFCVGYFHIHLSEVREVAYDSLCCSSFKEGI